MRLMGEMVGPTGQVMGLDTDGRIGREACNILQATTKSQFAFIEGNVTTLSEIDGQPFDVTFARIVLMHIDDPVAVLRKMYGWTKPGGYLVIQEYDFSSWGIYPRSEAAVEVQRVFYGVCEKAKRDTRIGYKLPAYFVEAGIGEPDGTDVAGMLSPLAQYKAFTEALYRSVLPLALQWNITTEAQSQRLFEDVSNITAQQHHYILWPSLVGAWKRKPMESDG